LQETAMTGMAWRMF